MSPKLCLKKNTKYCKGCNKMKKKKVSSQLHEYILICISATHLKKKLIFSKYKIDGKCPNQP